MEKKVEIKLSEQEIKTILSVMSLVHRIPHGKLTARGYSLGAESVNFLKK